MAGRVSYTNNVEGLAERTVVEVSAPAHHYSSLRILSLPLRLQCQRARLASTMGECGVYMYTAVIDVTADRIGLYSV